MCPIYMSKYQIIPPSQSNPTQVKSSSSPQTHPSSIVQIICAPPIEIESATKSNVLIVFFFPPAPVPVPPAPPAPLGGLGNPGNPPSDSSASLSDTPPYPDADPKLVARMIGGRGGR